jgi:hypothetical protein
MPLEDRSGHRAGLRFRAHTAELLLTDVRTAVAQLEAGQGVSNEDAQAELRRRFGQ